MNRNGLLLISLVAALAIASSALAQTVFRYAHPNAPASIPGQYATLFAELVAEKTGGSVRIELYPSSQLGGAREMIEGTQFGIIQMGHNDFAALAQLEPDLAVFNLPYLFSNPEHALLATDPERSEVAAELSARLQASSDVRILGSFFYGIRELTTANTPVYTPADLRGLRIRAIPVPIWIAMVEGMGAIPTPVDFAELPTALATGVVSGQENPPTTIYANALYEQQSYLMLTDHMLATLAIYVNETAFRRLSEDQRAALTAAAREAAEAIRERSIAEHEAVLALLADAGLTIIGPDEGLDVDAFREAVVSYVRARFPEWDDMIARIQALVD
jgi:tripartite ATP-independent transporter DctP family solute receptor